MQREDPNEHVYAKKIIAVPISMLREDPNSTGGVVATQVRGSQ